MKTTDLTYLKTQSTQRLSLYKDPKSELYYIYRLKDKKFALLGDRERAENFILDGLEANKEEITTLKFE